ncbi:hypothetical protein WUBG_19266, partial [Wuchereria bancrofti]
METKPLEPLHVNNDGLWALTVALSDESYECLTCLVSHKFLVELIGWTPEEALALMETKPLEPLHVNNDGLWALTVALSDESYECLTCLVSHKFLVELIGWTPEEAL